MGNKRYTIQEIIKIAESKNVKLISTIYTNTKSRLFFECKIHGIFQTPFQSLIQSRGCPSCSLKIRAKTQSMSLDEVKNFFIKRNYIPLFDNYKNAKEKLLCSCSKHGNFFINYDNLKQGKGCPLCKWDSVSNLNKLKQKEYDLLIKELAQKKIKPLFDYKDYVGLKKQAKFKCEIHGNFTNSLDSLKYRKGCRKCTVHHSKTQDEICNFIKSLEKNVVENDRKTIKPLEIDIYIPNKKIGIEYCGLYWHNELYKTKKEHKNKLDMANNKNIKLLTIFEDEWKEKSNQIKNYIKSLLNQNTIKIHARKTNILIVEKNIAKTFLEDSHIQGACNFSIAIGLYHKQELVGLMTGGKHHRGINKQDLVLNRMVFKANTTIVGGASKLLNQLKKYAILNGYTKIVSWSDNRWSVGNVYDKIGFVKSLELAPDYSYMKRETRFPKQSFTKKRLLKMGAIGDTEREMALSLGYRRIWDCGKIKWEFTF